MPNPAPRNPPPDRLRTGIVCGVLLLAAGCGKKGPNLPPLRIVPSPAQELRVRQIGRGVRVTARLPMQETDGGDLGPKAQVRILRMQAGEMLRPGAVASGYLQRQFEKGSQVLAGLSGEALSQAAPGGLLRFDDTTPVAGSAAPAGAGTGARRSAGTPAAGRLHYLYSVLIIDSEGKRSPLPPPFPIEVIEPPAPPHDLKLETVEGEVRLSWQPGGTGPGLFNVYRRIKAAGGAVEQALNPQPIEGTSYVDTTFAYGETYRYFVRALAGKEGKGAPLRESEDSPEVEVRPLDIFPPQAPTGVAVAAEGSVIRIYWFPNGESDLGGYRIYRREAADAELRLLGQAGASDSSYADASARPGVRYHYVVTAFDTASPPNESVRSEERAESLPAEGTPAPAAPAPSATPSPTPAPPGKGR